MLHCRLLLFSIYDSCMRKLTLKDSITIYVPMTPNEYFCGCHSAETHSSITQLTTGPLDAAMTQLPPVFFEHMFSTSDHVPSLSLVATCGEGYLLSPNLSFLLC
jgi:hypothetical protein